jgi:hypothetical protein
VLRTVALALFLAFAVGFGIGTWLRCSLERPERLIGARPDAQTAPSTTGV